MVKWSSGGMDKVLLTRPILEPGYSILREKLDVVMPKGDPPSKEELLELVKDVRGILCHLTERIDREIIENAPNLKAISTVSVGVDHIDVAEATKRGIIVTHTPEVLTETTADLAWALIMATARRVAEADRFIRKRMWKGPWRIDFMLGHDVYGATLGIIGLGRIGQAVVRRARGFRMKILYYDIVRRETIERELNAEYTPLEELLKKSDIITIHVPLTPETFHLIDEEKLKKMKNTSILVNTSRGKVVDGKALYKALREGWIAGAGLDVFEEEPIPDDDPLLELENIVLTPHIASASYATRRKMSEVAALNLIEALRGGTPMYVYNPEVIGKRRNCP